MKRMIALALAAAIFSSPLISAAQALEPVRARAGLAAPEDAPEGWRGRRSYRRGRGRRRGRSGGGALGAGIAGAIIGGLIVGAIKSAHKEKPRQPTLYCDQYGNCWYQ